MKPSPTVQVFRAAWSALLEYRAQLLKVGLAVLVISAVGLAAPLFTAWLLDGPLAFAEPGSLKVIVLGLAGVYAAQAFFGWFKGRVLVYLDAATTNSLQGGAMRRFLQAPFLGASKRPLGDLLMGFKGLKGGYAFMSKQVLPVLISVLSGVMQLITLFLLAPSIGFWVLGCLAVLLAGTAVSARKLALARAEAAEARAAESLALADLLAGVQTLKASGLEAVGMARWAGHLRRRVTRGALADQRQMVLTALNHLISEGFPSLAVLLGASQTLDGGATLGVTLAAAFLGAGVIAAWLEASELWMAYLSLKPQLAYAAEVLSLEPVVEPQLPATRAEAGWVIAEDLWFRYHPDAPWVVRGLNLRVGPGETHHIEGASGFGKSTTLRLLAGVLQPERGEVRVGGRAPGHAKGDILYLPQSPLLVADSIRRNLDLYSGGAPWDKLEEAARETGFDAVVQDLGMGYETRLATAGENLSGGQKQLLLLTACLASQAKIVLLDEAMAGLDWGRRAKLAHSSLLRQKTILFASHDGSPIPSGS